jgi:hypothetical protein
MKNAWKIAIAVLILASTGLTIKIVLLRWFPPLATLTFCFDSSGGVPNYHPLFRACIERQAEIFLGKDYAESKDLAKTFLTLISASLVASITFSEKIVDVGKATLVPLSTMIVCWVLLLAALVACGAGLALMTTAAGIAAYEPSLDYRQIERRAIQLFLGSGVAYAFALIALIVAGVASLVEKRAAARSTV